MGPWAASPLKERGYKGDDSLESMLHTLATGDKKSREELDLVGERIFLLHRALTIRDMGTKEMRKEHDIIPEWVYYDPQKRPVYTKGTIHLDREDVKLAMDMYYDVMGWDKATGAPTAEAYKNVGLAKVAEELSKKGLLP
jgi:aldehyde:ferredoxin oxidoreductase